MATDPFTLSEEQEALQQSLRSLLDDRHDAAYIRQRILSNGLGDLTLWKELQQIGLFEFFAGTDLSLSPRLADLCLVAAESGRALITENLVESLMSGPWLLSRLVSAEEAEQIVGLLSAVTVESVRQGNARIALAPLLDERDESPGLQLDSGGLVSGTLRMLKASAQSVAVVAPVASEHFLIRIDPQLMQEEPALDRTQQIVRLEIKNAPALKLGMASAQNIIRTVRVLRAAELGGISERVLELTLEHVNSRKQFGVPVGSFQAVQHRAADMRVASDKMRALTRFAAWAQDSSPAQAELSSLAAIHLSRQSCVEIIESAIQLHGGVGFTWEHDLHLYLRRAISLRAFSVCGTSVRDQALHGLF